MKYKQNDTIIDKNGNTRKILGIVRDYYIVAYDNSDEVCRELLTLLELDFYGFTLQVTEWTPEIEDSYFYVDLTNKLIYPVLWENDKIDKTRQELNLIFKTLKQAEARLLEVVALLKK